MLWYIKATYKYYITVCLIYIWKVPMIVPFTAHIHIYHTSTTLRVCCVHTPTSIHRTHSQIPHKHTHTHTQSSQPALRAASLYSSYASTATPLLFRNASYSTPSPYSFLWKMGLGTILWSEWRTRREKWPQGLGLLYRGQKVGQS